VVAALTAAAAIAGDFSPAESLQHAPLAVSVPGTALYMFAWMFFAFGAGHLAATEARMRRELAFAHAELMAAQSLLSDGTRVAERLRISRELHDAVGHHLASLSINLQLASRLAEGPAAKPLGDAHTVAKVLLAEVREAVGTLRDPRHTDLRRALELLAGGIAEPTIHLDLAADLDKVEPVCAHVLFRSIQEAATNTIKHSGARNLWVRLSRTDAGWEVWIRDDGCGCSSIVPGNGLKGVAERIREAGGELSFESRVGEGFTWRASVPAPGGLE
jgi:signal transduction histidine kinase